MSLFPFIPLTVQSLGSTKMIFKEYEVDLNHWSLTGRIVEGAEALKIWIYKTLKTERYKYLIYSWDFGVELEQFIGKGYEQAFIESEMKRHISEALLVNPYIQGVDKFEVSFSEGLLSLSFDVLSDYGEVHIDEFTNI